MTSAIAIFLVVDFPQGGEAPLEAMEQDLRELLLKHGGQLMQIKRPLTNRELIQHGNPVWPSSHQALHD
jgi:hypothetical protein